MKPRSAARIIWRAAICMSLLGLQTASATAKDNDGLASRSPRPDHIRVAFKVETPPEFRASDFKDWSRNLALTAALLDDTGRRNGGILVLESTSTAISTSGFETTATLPPGLWRVDIQAPGLWIPQTVVALEVNQGDIEVALSASEGGRIKAQIQFEDDGVRPESFEIRLVVADQPDSLIRPGDLERVERFCPLEESSQVWLCPVPSQRSDLKIDLPGFIPHYFWDQQVAFGMEEDLGVLNMKVGSSVVGWVTKPNDSLNEADISISLTPILGDGILDSSLEQDAARAQLRGSTTSPNEQGFFRFLGLEPGNYKLTASAERLANYENAPVPVLEGKETKIAEPIELTLPASLTLYITPPTAPDSEPWQVLLTPAYKPTRNSELEWADLSGTFTKETIDPGRYHLMILSGEPRDRTRWLREDIEVRDDMSHFLDVPVVEVFGVLARGGHSLDGDIWFGGKFGEISIHMTATADDGYAGTLPRAGEWDVDIATRENSVQSLESVVVIPKDNGGPTELDLDVPFTNIYGKVVDSVTATPIPNSTVIGMSTVGEKTVGKVASDANGKFELSGLKPGRLWLVASSGDGESNPLLVDLREGLRTELTILEIEPRVVRRVKLVSDEGVVAGAKVWYRTSAEGPRFEHQALTGPDGIAEIVLPKKSASADLMILPGSQAMRVTRVEIPEDGSVIPEVGLSRFGSLLVIEPGGRSAAQFLLFKDGIRLISVPSLLHWTRLTTGQNLNLDHLDSIMLPRVDWGYYALCPKGKLDHSDREILSQQGLPAICQGGYLAPGGSLTLSFE